MIQLGRQRAVTLQLAQCCNRLFAARAQPEGGPADAFSAHLQSKTEQELMELLERRNQPAAEPPQEPMGSSAGGSQQVAHCA